MVNFAVAIHLWHSLQIFDCAQFEGMYALNEFQQVEEVFSSDFNPESLCIKDLQPL